jgi:hypothetical protein
MSILCKRVPFRLQIYAKLKIKTRNIYNFDKVDQIVNCNIILYYRMFLYAFNN